MNSYKFLEKYQDWDRCTTTYFFKSTENGMVVGIEDNAGDLTLVDRELIPLYDHGENTSEHDEILKQCVITKEMIDDC